MATKKFQINICHGPSKSGLIASFSAAEEKEPNQPYKVTFEVIPGQELPQNIASPNGDLW